MSSRIRVKDKLMALTGGGLAVRYENEPLQEGSRDKRTAVQLDRHQIYAT